MKQKKKEKYITRMRGKEEQDGGKKLKKSKGNSREKKVGLDISGK